jgi:2-keto-4-pentenoate hydratase/2-oxohepta-3-ene-1,7-dioic acid hydratase in catechol pathway
MPYNKTVGRVFCIGRNYRLHAQELDNEIPESPVVFIKPKESICAPGTAITYLPHWENLQYEAEFVVRIGKEGCFSESDSLAEWVDGFTIGLDLTLRNLQKELKIKGLPWEKSKAFDQSAPLGDFVPFTRDIDIHAIHFDCSVNGFVRQKGFTGAMIFSVNTCLLEISRYWRLIPGDILFTGTPEGVGEIRSGDCITLSSSAIGEFNWQIV